ncbi:MAG: ATP-binding protein, partial [Paracoccaceae bacterium]|nr:ATP-binding protein [Paracoccaceae bacterium]
MTRELKAQQNRLLENSQQTENRRRLFDSVLSSVTSGVIAVDPEGQITLANKAAKSLLDRAEKPGAVSLGQALPEFQDLFEKLRSDELEIVRSEVKVTRAGEQEHLLVQLATRRSTEGVLEGYVVAFDDVTDLVVAQRTAAWGDVARRIAHEIKNPLTPIQLCAERISRKFGRNLAPKDADSLAQMTGIIVRQTNELRHIVVEFSKFARMPEPQQKPKDISIILRDAVMLQDSGHPDVLFEIGFSNMPLWVSVDETLISQALGNLLKNAAEATETKALSMPKNWVRKVKIYCTQEADYAVVSISDNGIGVPSDRSRLFEPYVTTREKGTGLGLPIVKKIIEDHGGVLSLQTAPAFADESHAGAMMYIRLKLLPQSKLPDDVGS